MKFKMPDEEFFKQRYRVDYFDGTMINFYMAKQNDESVSDYNKNKKYSWNIEKVGELIDSRFVVESFTDESEYESPNSSYTYYISRDLKSEYNEADYLIVFIKDRKSIIFERFPFIPFCQFLSDYCDAFPDDLPLLLVQEGDAVLVPITKDTTVEDIYIGLLKDTEESWAPFE